MNDAFRLFFKGLARHAPGLDTSTLQALEACTELPERPRVLDLGSGTGASALVLAEQLGVPVTAVDLGEESLATLQERAERRGIGALIETHRADFTSLEKIVREPFDLIWSEGAIYVLGWKEGLAAWGQHVNPGGYLVLTDCVWNTTTTPSAEAERFWSQEYPGMGTEAAHIRAAKALGFETIASFPLPSEAWERYYNPIEARAQLVLGSETSAPSMRAVAAEMAREIELWKLHGDAWNYVFFVLQRSIPPSR